MHYSVIALLYHSLVEVLKYGTCTTFFLKLFKIIYEWTCNTTSVEYLGIVRLSSKDDFII